MRFQLIFGTLLLGVLLSATLTVWFVAPVRAATLLVPQQYPTIQAAVTAAKAGDTIQVSAGTYRENVIVTTRNLIIVGAGAATTIVDGGGRNSVFNIQADNVEIKQFTIRGGNRYDGVDVYYLNSAAVIHDNIIRDNAAGVSISESGGHTIENNVLINNSMYGITVTSFSSNNIIRNNSISESAFGIEVIDTSSTDLVINNVSNSSYGLYLARSNGNNVSANTLTGNSWSIYLTYSNSNIVGNNMLSSDTVGIEVLYSQGNSIVNNTLTGSSYGIYLGYCGANPISGNTVSSYDWGLELYSSTGTTIKENTIRDNSWGLYIVQSSNGNSIYHNNIINNVKQVYQDPTSGSNTWRTPTTPYQGNFWSDYKGTDTNGDGVGDTYLPWAGVDYYPLISPLGEIHDIALIRVSTSRNRTYLGLSINVDVVAKNLGTTTETFNINAYYNQSIIGTQIVSGLAPGYSVSLVFKWNTTDASVSHFVISANTSIVPFDVDTSNNGLTDGTVYVKTPGDINGDGRVGILDGALLSLNFGRTAEEFPDGDINGDGDINVLDAIIISTRWTG